MPKYSIVVPFHNEQESVTALYDRLKAVMESTGDSFELVFVDDGSLDRTYKLLREIVTIDSARQLVEVVQAFSIAHEMGLATVLWCYLRNNAFKKDKDFHVSADLTGQANHLGVTIQADIIKQKLATHDGGYAALNAGGTSYGKFDRRMYTQLTRTDWYKIWISARGSNIP